MARRGNAGGRHRAFPNAGGATLLKEEEEEINETHTFLFVFVDRERYIL
jgi:hypothetical protein